ncbi:MAG: YbhB/YbcL family Raf kinase inhibitor-like protein [Desulfovibrionaceae bacterium]|nr:YbhB/YbcL family Raf kinase inhibitor-like protein [Desulfovibrionaceae bacterium]
MRITSPAFADGQSIPDRYTCDSEELSPALAFHDVPAGTRSLALIVDDPDAPMGAWDHWLLFNLPPDAAGIPELPLGAEASELGRTAKSGLNSWRETGWGGPCPPSGTHRYYFTLYALDIMLPLKEGASRADLARAMEHHVLATARLMGTYSRGR